MKGWGRITMTVMAVGLLLSGFTQTGASLIPPVADPGLVTPLKSVNKVWISGQLRGFNNMPRRAEGVPILLEHVGSPPYRQLTFTDKDGKFRFLRSLLAPKGTYRIRVQSPKGAWCQEIIFQDNAKTSHFFNVDCTPPDPRGRR